MMMFWKTSVARGSAGVRAGAALALLAVAVVACGRGPGGSDTDDTVDNTNRCTMEVELPARSAALEDAMSIDAVDWTSEPTIEAGMLVATGTLAQDVKLFDPLNEDDRDSPAFSVYYVGHTEALLELVPNSPDGRCWETTEWKMTVTIAPTEVGTPEGAGDRGFTIKASHPYFMDFGSGDLELRVWGYDADGNEALLSKVAIGTE